MLEIESYEYKDIPGYEGLYAVTSCGKVWSYRRKRFLKSSNGPNGYQVVGLHHDGKQKTCYVHRLVLEAFNPIENMGEYDANHLNEQKADNRIENLCWMTHKENLNYGTRNQRISNAIGKAVRCVETGIIYPSQKSAADAFGLARQSINYCCRGKSKTSAGFHWEYVEELEKNTEM